MQITEAPIKATGSASVVTAPLSLPDHKQLPESDGTFVKNFQEHPQSYVKMKPNGRGHYAIPPMGVELGLILENDISWLRWWDESGNLLLTGDERAVQAEQKAQRLAERLRALGYDPENV